MEVEINLSVRKAPRIASWADWAERPAELLVTKPEFIGRSEIPRTTNKSDACLNAPAAREMRGGIEVSEGVMGERERGD